MHRRDFWAWLRSDCWAGKVLAERVSGLAAVDGVHSGLKQVLPWPAGGQMDVDTARGLADASTDFEQLSAQSFDLCRAPGLEATAHAEQVDQVVGGPVQQRAEGVGQEAVTAQPVGTGKPFLNSSMRFSHSPRSL